MFFVKLLSGVSASGAEQKQGEQLKWAEDFVFGCGKILKDLIRVSTTELLENDDDYDAPVVRSTSGFHADTKDHALKVAHLFVYCDCCCLLFVNSHCHNHHNI